MTIFLEIAKQFLQREITELSEASYRADNSTMNTTLTFFGYGRNVELSSEKRTLLSSLHVEIGKLKDGKKDSNTLDSLQELIITCKKEGAGKSLDKKFDEGSFGQGMQHLENIVRAIFDKLEKLQLIGVSHDADPLNSFRYFAALYCTQKIINLYKAATLERLVEHPQISSIRELAGEKEELITNTIEACIKDLDLLDKKHLRYNEARKDRVLNCIAQLQRDNVTLCEKFTSKLFRPTVGYLGECLKQATTEIEGKPASKDDASAEQKSSSNNRAFA